MRFGSSTTAAAVLAFVFAAFFAVSSASAKHQKKPTGCRPPAQSSEEGKRFSGNISWYGVPFHGRKTASGRIFDMNKLTAAHKTLPFGTKILIENPKTGRVCVVEIIDRGPYSGNRIIDVSRESARKLGILPGGLAFCNCLIVGRNGAPPKETDGEDGKNSSKETDTTPPLKGITGGTNQETPESGADR